MSKYTTTTAALKATTADIRTLDAKNIKLNGEQIPSKVLDERGDFVTDQDLWGTTVTTDENGVVHVSHKFLSNPNIDVEDEAWNRSVKSIKDNKAYTSTDASGEPLCNIQTEMIKDGTNMFYWSPIAYFSSDLSSLTNGTNMFHRTRNLTSFSSDLSYLTNGTNMFALGAITSFSGDLSSLTNGNNMFRGCANLTSFSSDLSSLTNGNYMFNGTSITSFNGNLSSLTNGNNMFSGVPLTSFSGDLSNLIDGYYMFYNTPLSSFNIELSSLTDGAHMFDSTHLTSFDKNLSRLIDGSGMFSNTPLTSFSRFCDLRNLVDGANMFYLTSITSFDNNLINLIDGSGMFLYTPLTSFNSDLSNLIEGGLMFLYTPLTSFNSDLSNLVDGYGMFLYTPLTSFNSDLSNLVDGSNMFSNTHKRGYTISYYKMVDGVKTKVTEHFRALGLISFNGDLSSLQTGYNMFGDGSDVTYTNEEGATETTKNITPLDEQSVMIIADTIKDLNGFTNWHSTVISSRRGIIHIGYDSAVCDTAKIEEYCTEIMNKGWTVYLNGTVQTTDDGIEGIVTTDEDGSTTVTPVPYYCKPVEVDQKDANWTDGEKYYIILGAQKVFGDDLSTYGMFTSIENAAMNMGFTPYEYIEEKTVEEN